MRYKFYFKWGGSPPPMSTVKDPKEQPTFIIPGNRTSTNSLQNPTTDPASLLWNFDERRQQITPKAIERIQKDSKPTKTSVTGGSHFQHKAYIWFSILLDYLLFHFVTVQVCILLCL